MEKEALHGKLWTSGRMSAEQLRSVEERFSTLLARSVVFDVQQDSALLGGFVAQIDGKTYDASLSGRLAELEREDSPDKGGETGPGKSEREGESRVIEDLHRRLEAFEPSGQVYESGTVSASADGVVFIEDLPGRSNGELLRFENDVFGMAMELEDDRVGAILFGDGDSVSAGSRVRGSGAVVEAPVGQGLLGRVIDPLGRPLDGRSLPVEKRMPIERQAPAIIDRQPVNQALETGLLAIDSMIPIGRGQRELIIGDRQTGKTQIAVDAMLNQKDSGVICVYCAIGQKASTVAQLIHTLEEDGAMAYSVVVAAMASDSSALQYIAPYAACTVAEAFMEDGRDVLIVYDDLSKHAMAYRTISLLLGRPPGREAYPGDVFYLHSRLLERSAHLNDEHGGGSMTALPIVETQAGDISAYIPTNIISITDGQIFLESELFNAGIRPAVNVGLSVSRVGRSAQRSAMRAVSGTLRIELAQYRELSVFAQFSSDIDPATRTQLDRGERLTQILKQDKQQPLKLSEQVALLLAFSEGAFDSVPTNKVDVFSQILMERLRSESSDELAQIDRTGELTKDVRQRLLEGILFCGAQAEKRQQERDAAERKALLASVARDEL